MRGRGIVKVDKELKLKWVFTMENRVVLAGIVIVFAGLCMAILMYFIFV
jgi:hypothetical protein